MRAINFISNVIVALLLIFTTVLAQRPSYAGPRPTGGLSQKDKYHTTATTVQSPAGGVNNRFGASVSNQSQTTNPNSIPYGATQRPPIGWPIVQPQAQYVPLNVNTQQVTPQFPLENRISGNDIGGGNGNSGAANNGLFNGNTQTTLSGNGIFPNNRPAFVPQRGQQPQNQQPPQFQPQPGFQNLPPPSPINGVPLDAHGDQALIDYLNTVPLDQRPFWFLNYQAIEAQRNSTNPAFTGAVGSRGSFLG